MSFLDQMEQELGKEQRKWPSIFTSYKAYRIIVGRLVQCIGRKHTKATMTILTIKSLLFIVYINVGEVNRAYFIQNLSKAHLPLLNESLESELQT